MLIMLDMKVYAVPADLHVPQVPWILPMYCWPSACLMRSHHGSPASDPERRESPKEDMDFVVRSLKRDRTASAKHVSL